MYISTTQTFRAFRHWSIAAGLSLTATAMSVQAQDRLPYDAVPGEIVIGMKRTSTPGGATQWSPGKTVNLLSLLGDDARVIREISSVDGIVISAPSLRTEAEIDNALVRLSAQDSVFAAERNHVYYASAQPADPMLDKMWFLKKISAFNAWDKRSKSPGIIVAVLDTGIQLDHADLKGRFWINTLEIPGNGKDDDGNGYKDDIHGWNFRGNNNKPDAAYRSLGLGGCKTHPTKRIYESHGTHVAGTIGAVANNNVGVAGISHDVRIMALRAFGKPCAAGTLDALIAAVAYATKNGAKVLNMSFGGGPPSKLMRREIEEAIKAGVSVVAAAGNTATNNDRHRHYPSGYRIDGLISVAATGPKDTLAKFSNYGRQTVDIAAPGHGILSTVPKGNDPSKAISGYANKSGTSMATPIIAGSIALMRAENPALDPVEIERRLMRAVDPVTHLKSRVRSGGRLNLAKLLHEAAKPVKKGSAKRTQPSGKEVTKQSIGGIRIDGGANRKRRPAGEQIPKSGNISGKSLY